MKKGAGIIDGDTGDMFVKKTLIVAATCLTRGQPGGGLLLSFPLCSSLVVCPAT